MMPIRELLDRIRWDPDFGRGDFQIGYYDRLQSQILRVALRDVSFDAQDHFAFRFYDDEGEEHVVPLHRIKEVYRDGERIWHREH